MVHRCDVGSGKTRTIVHRLAWLAEQGVPASDMLLLTFTRKASREMLLRATDLLGYSIGGVHGGTFHSFAFSVLRQYRPAWAEGPVTVMDSADSASAIQQCKERLKVGKGDRSFPKTQTIIGLLSKARNKEISIGDVLQRECSYDVVQSVHEQLRGRIQEHKESHDPEPLELSVREVGEVLSNSGVPSEKAEAFEAECRRQYGENAALNPKNLIEAGKFQITTPEVKITVSPEYSYMVEARVIDGRKYILIPADENVEVNGITVNIPNPQTAEEI